MFEEIKKTCEDILSGKFEEEEVESDEGRDNRD